MELWFLLAVLACTALTLAQFTPPTYPSTVLKILCIIKPQTTISGAFEGGIMNQSVIDAYADGFLNIWPQYIYNITGGTVRYETAVVVSPDALTATNPNPTYEGEILPEDVQGDITRYNITVANWDHVLFIGSQPGSTLWTNSWQLDDKIGWTSIFHDGTSPYDEGWVAGNTHETLWSIGGWFEQPQYMGSGQNPGDAQGQGTVFNAGYYNYTADSGPSDSGSSVIGVPYHGWTKWYQDFFNGQICMQDGKGGCQPGSKKNLGLGPNAYKFPSRREAHHSLSGGYLATSVTWPGEPATLSTFTGSPTFNAKMNDRPWTTGGGNYFGPGNNLASNPLNGGGTSINGGGSSTSGSGATSTGTSTTSVQPTETGTGAGTGSDAGAAAWPKKHHRHQRPGVANGSRRRK